MGGWAVGRVCDVLPRTLARQAVCVFTWREREMTFKTNKLRDAISFALVVGTAGTGVAFAQEAQQVSMHHAADVSKLSPPFPLGSFDDINAGVFSMSPPRQ